MAAIDPRYAADDQNRTIAAYQPVLVEIGHVLARLRRRKRGEVEPPKRNSIVKLTPKAGSVVGYVSAECGSKVKQSSHLSPASQHSAWPLAGERLCHAKGDSPLGIAP